MGTKPDARITKKQMKKGLGRDVWTDAMTGRTGDIIHHHSNVLNVIGRDGRTTGRTKK